MTDDAAVLEAERAKIERYYGQLANPFRLFGAEEPGRRYVVVRLARYAVNAHVDYSRASSRGSERLIYYGNTFLIPPLRRHPVGAHHRARDGAARGGGRPRSHPVEVIGSPAPRS